MMATRTYLELADPAAFRPRRVTDPQVRVSKRDDCPPELLTYLYAEVGRDYRWVDRLPWTEQQTRAYLADPAVSVWLLTVASQLAGYFELRRDADLDASTEIGIVMTAMAVIRHWPRKIRMTSEHRTAPIVPSCTSADTDDRT